ncbi:MAG: hypothetical protein JSV38_08215 [Desulfobacterales bacterium]|nr:MAG: hypothetical protein JSV38_08215 [Desulfobacterales bacterium]
MKRIFLKLSVLTIMLIGLPMAGIILAGFPVSRYLEFPPESKYVLHAPFSWLVFSAYAVFIVLVTLPLIIKGVSSSRQDKTRGSPASNFPWWGWIGVTTGIVAWLFAWSRFPWFASFQPHTFTPLWLSFILVINALCHRRTGRCMMVDRTRFFLLLFPISALFWWFFEYLNRFVQNWSYTGVHYSSFEYFCYATISFSTVLPAVLGTQEWIVSLFWVQHGFTNNRSLKLSLPRVSSWIVLAISGIGLACIGVWPDYLFSLLWISPLLIIVSLQHLMGESHVLSDIGNGDWRLVVASTSAALFCGLFWEMWNYYSLAKWQYSVPFVGRFHVFEMPILGYAGYLPFGLECAIIGMILEAVMKNPKES